MAKKKYTRTQESTAPQAGNQQEEQQGQALSLQTILLGIIALALVIQTFLMLSDGEDTPAYIPSGTAAAPAGGNNNMTAPPASSPQSAANNQQPNINVTMPNGQQQAAQPQQAANTTAVAFSEKTKDFGTVSSSSGPLEHTFTVTNNGSQPLSYTQVRGDAGATVVSYPTNPIPPGGSGEVKVTLDPSTKSSGIQSWNIHLDGNTNPGHQHLILQANVTN